MAPPRLSTQPRELSTALVLVRQAPDLLHTFWTVLAPPFKSGARDTPSAALSWTFPGAMGPK